MEEIEASDQKKTKKLLSVNHLIKNTIINKKI